MVRWIICFFLFGITHSLFAKEWQNLKSYQKATQNENLLPSDWLKTDRTKNTVIWQQANIYNLKNNLFDEYNNVVQRRDFYQWLYTSLETKGHEVVWVKMAHFISKKLHLIEVFPYSLLLRKRIKEYAKLGSEVVFKNAFIELQQLYVSDTILKREEAIEWDKNVLKKEQYIWIDSIYKTIDTKSLKTLEHIAKRKFLYGLVVPKAIEFKGELSNPETRYNYALEVLKPYCENRYKS
ncbi:Insecticidal toxin complex protein [Sabulilitoribacter multivorans]|uniref:Insecticidal toxin complex protein n=1 Tax=Flaviramulus multivorans TaxID=1304750 RepID=A0ABS9IHM8_9FLAO|nr:Insecticidal toxin complex protein [Flaviramulus multivorans]MCF7560269.1 Insecticidal toxin complex protein [Flaviramulus multivorans]